MYSIYIFTVVLATFTPLTRADSKVLRVHDGTTADVFEYPYVVCLKDSRNHRICTGSLIASRWVLTAAHCLGTWANYIQYGNLSQRLVDTKSRRKVLKIIRHPRFTLTGMYYNDIGLLFVNPVYLSKYGRISAVEFTTLTGVIVSFAGFGRTIYLIPETKNKIKRLRASSTLPLQRGEGVVRRCDEPHGRYICVSPKCYTQQLTLEGDSGGPLFLDNKIIGVVFGSTRYGYPKNTERQFTPVSPYLTWIHNITASVTVL